MNLAIGLASGGLLRRNPCGFASANSQHAPPAALLADSFWFVKLANSDSLNVVQREVRVPAGGFECSEVPYAELVGAALPPDPVTGAVTFRIEVLGQQGRTEERVGANQNRTIGAFMSVDAATGKNETYEGLPEIAGNFRDTAR
jgi:hypothetical protein